MFSLADHFPQYLNVSHFGTPLLAHREIPGIRRELLTVLTRPAQTYCPAVSFKGPSAVETLPRNASLKLWHGIYARSELRQLADSLSSGGLEVFSHRGWVDVAVVHHQQLFDPL